MKRRISLLLAVVMVLGSFSTIFAETEKPAITAEQEAAEFLEKNGVLKGNLAGDLELDKNMRRQDSVIMLSRLLGVEEEAEAHEETEAFKKFEDIRDKYYNGFISWAVENGYFVGHTDVRFGYNEDITARDYSVVLLRALGYGEEVKGEEGWKAAYAKAKELGLLENVEAKELDEITRGQMAVMTFNALGTKVKGSEKTLAEELGIEMPTPDVLEAEVSANNLKEIIVKFNKDMDRDVVEKIQNYTTGAGNGVEDVRLLEDKQTVVLTLKDEMRNNREYKLTIRGIDEEVNKEYKFNVVDNAAPVVEEVIGLGTKGIKVVMSEPVKTPSASLFRLNGSTFYGSVNVVGREVILRPYSGSFPEGENTLRVGSLTDYAGFKSTATEHTFEIVKDAEGPEVVSVNATNDKVVVEFNKAVDITTIKTDNIFHGDKNTNKPDSYKVLSGNRVEYTFGEKPLPTGSVKLTISGVANYSGVAMKAHTDIYKVNLDETRPEVISSKYEDRVATIVFSKAMYKDDVKLENFVMKDKDNVTKKNLIKEVKLVDSQKVEVAFYNTVDSANYTLEVSGLRDNTILKNTMLPYTMDIKGGAKSDVSIIDIRHLDSNSEYDKTERVRVMFNREMDLETVTNARNFVLYDANGKTYNVSNIEDSSIEVSDGGKTITIIMPGNKTEFKKLYIAATLKDINGNTLNGAQTGTALEFENVTLSKPTLNSSVANKKNEITLTFSTDLASNSDTTGLSFANATVKSYKVDGKKLIITTNETLPANAKDLTVTIAEDNGIKNLINEKATQVEAEVITDSIAPTLMNVVEKREDTKVTFELTFDEEVVADQGILNGLEVKQDGTKLNLFNLDAKVLTKTNSDKIQIEITLDKAPAKDATFFFNIVDGTAAVRDLKANAAKPLDGDLASKAGEFEIITPAPETK